MKRHRLRDPVSIGEFHNLPVPSAIPGDRLIGQWQSGFREWEFHAIVLSQFETKPRSAFCVFNQVKRSGIRTRNFASFAQNHSQKLLDVARLREGNSNSVQFLEFMADAGSSQSMPFRTLAVSTRFSAFCLHFWH